MKNIAIIALSALMIIACSQTETNNGIRFNTASADKEVRLSNDESSPICAVHLQIAYATEKNGDKAAAINATIQKQLLDMSDLTMQHAVDSFANNYTSTYVRNFLPLYNQNRADTMKRSSYDFHYIITTQTYPGSKQTTAYIATIDYYEGGAHGINQQMVMNFDNKTGLLLTLDDIFVKGYEHQLNERLTKALCEKLDADNIEALRQKGYLHSMEMFVPKNFILYDETITFIYNPYEIASYDKGPTELTIGFMELYAILKSEYQL